VCTIRPANNQLFDITRIRNSIRERTQCSKFPKPTFDLSGCFISSRWTHGDLRFDDTEVSASGRRLSVGGGSCIPKPVKQSWQNAKMDVYAKKRVPSLGKLLLTRRMTQNVLSVLPVYGSVSGGPAHPAEHTCGMIQSASQLCGRFQMVFCGTDTSSHRMFPCAAGYTTLPETFKLGFIMACWNAFVWTIVGGAWWKFLGLY
jgi:hypothetical protein